MSISYFIKVDIYIDNLKVNIYSHNKKRNIGSIAYHFKTPLIALKLESIILYF